MAAYTASASILGVRPYRHALSLKVAEEFIRTLHSGAHSFELWAEERVKVVICSSETEAEVKKKVESFYQSSELYTPDREFPEFRATFAARIRLKKVFFPIRTDISGDPLNAVIAAMTGHRAVYQVVFAPAHSKYVKKLVASSRAMQAGRVEGWINPRVVKPGKTEKDLARELAEKAKSPLFYAEIRICADSDVNLSFLDLFETNEQGFTVEVYRGKKVLGFVEEMVARELRVPWFGGKSVLSAKELSLLAHIPGEEVTGDVEWTYERKDLKPPSGEED